MAHASTTSWWQGQHHSSWLNGCSYSSLPLPPQQQQRQKQEKLTRKPQQQLHSQHLRLLQVRA
jgi:hypothetical protein